MTGPLQPEPAPPLRGMAPVAPPDDSDQWHRMHPVTPAVKSWKIFVVVLGLIAVNAAEQLRHLSKLSPVPLWLAVLGVVVVVTLIGAAYAAIAWRMTRYAITDDAVHLRTGVLFRQQRQARLDRLQAVDVVQPGLARILGLAELRLEVAGGPGSGVPLAYLREPEAEQLRAELLARAAGLHHPTGPAAVAPGAAPAVGVDPTGVATAVPGAPAGAPAAPTAGPVAQTAGQPSPPGAERTPAPTAPERPVYEVPLGRLLASTLLSSATIWLGIFGVAVIVGIVLTRQLGVIVGLLPAVLGMGSFVWTRFNRGANFRAAISPDGIRVRHGLTETRAQTLPPGRVQAVRISQGLLWRRAGWWQVEVNVAGYAAGEEGTRTENILLPVGTHQDALTALWLVLPDLGTPDPFGLVDEGLTGTSTAHGFVTAPRSSRWLDPVAWRRHGVAVTDRALLMRAGRLNRSLVLVPHERTQSLGLGQGPLERRLGLASFQVHSVPGPVVARVRHLDGRAAAALMDEQADRARTARAGAGPEQWMRG